MKIEKTIRDDHQAALTVEVSAERFEKAKQKAARKLSQKVKIPGFRPGKAPYDVIRAYIGEPAIVEEAVEILVDEIYPEVLKEADIEPAAAGALEKIENLDPPRFVFTVPLRPEVDLGDYKSIRLDYAFEEPGDEKVEESIEELRRMFARTETVDRPIEDGDYVLAAVKIFTEESEEPVESRESIAFVAHKEATNDDEWPFKGFSAEVIGMTVGESKTITHTFAEEAAVESLRGKEARIEVEIKSIRALNIPELDDEFAKMAGAENLESLRQAVRENVRNQAKAEYEDKYYQDLFETIKAGATIKYPPQLVENEIENVLHELEHRLEAQGLNLDLYLRSQDKTKESFIEEEVRPAAIARVERGLILDEVARREAIDLQEDEVEAEFQNLLSEMQYNGQVDFSKLRTKRQQKEFAEFVTFEAVNRLMTRRTLERLKTIATGEAEKQAEAAAEEAASEEAAEAPEAEAAGEETAE